MMTPCSGKLLTIVGVIAGLFVTWFLAAPNSLPGTKLTWYFTAGGVILAYALFATFFYGLPAYVNHRIAKHEREKKAGLADNLYTGPSETRQAVGDKSVIERVEKSETTTRYVPDDDSEDKEPTSAD